MATKQTMTDKEYMEDVLLTSKQLTNLYHSAVQESSTENLHYQLKDNLNQSIDVEHQIFSTISQKGWYPQEQADAQQINKARTKFMSQS